MTSRSTHRSSLRRRASAAIALASAVLLASCAAPAATEVIAGAEDSAVDKLGIILYTSNPWNKEYGEAFEIAAKKLGVDEVSVLNAEADPQKQLSQVQTLLDQGYKGIAINLVGGLSVGQLNTLFAENDAYYTTVFELTQWNTTYASDGHYLTYISPDYPGSAEAVVDELAAALPDGGDVIAIGGSASLSATLSNQAWTGFEAGLAANPELTLVGNLETDYTAEGGKQKTADLLSRFPDAKAVLATDGASAEGAVAAIREAGLEPGTDVLVVSADDAGTVGELVQSGTVLAGASLPAALVANYDAAVLFDQLNGVTPDPALQQLWLDMPVVNAENVDDYLARYGKPLGEQFDTALFSRYLTPEDWDYQGGFRPVTDLAELWPGVPQPADFDAPAQFTELLDSGAFEKAAAEIAEHNEIAPFAPLPE
ncbi:sugar ABC transporter substrate-binding protein [Microbacterium sp. 18062]|uniref:sugar ABC transporter substrate-binding protein n=1 Tax=Microbacterium sp. 18062 TaxID=2681410 RepID=UPI00135A9BD9|nr:sugar ABC transporter substrate-binding protein [Microbacterium sp. 18062]